jgi:hypothetical protein
MKVSWKEKSGTSADNTRIDLEFTCTDAFRFLVPLLPLILCSLLVEVAHHELYYRRSRCLSLYKSYRPGSFGLGRATGMTYLAPSNLIGSHFIQAQLSQSLYTPTENATTTYSKIGHCNSPIARTPSSSFSWSDRSGPGEAGYTRPNRSSSIVAVRRQRQNSIDEQAYFYSRDIDESDEDERMVEDLLYPSSPVSSGPPSTPASSQFIQYGLPLSGTAGYPSSPPSPRFHSDSQFTTTDPFYLAQLQMQHEQAQNPFSSSSFFSQLGKPTPHSPFSQSQTQPQYHYGNHQQFSACEVDRHSHQQPMLVGTVSFDR